MSSEVRKRGVVRQACALVTMLAAALSLTPVGAYAGELEYQLYPSPQAINYRSESFIMRDAATVVVEDEIDSDTEARLEEALALKGISIKRSDAPSKDPRSLNVLVGTNGSKGVVDTHLSELAAQGIVELPESAFSHNDAYVLFSIPGDKDRPDTLAVLGSDTDSAFYGLTTLFQIFQQVDGLELRGFTLEDYADVKTRGFIEGYYGNPWTTEDRVRLMEWGGYYKLNAYVYAPKDDPKHRTNWRDLYTAEEIEQQLRPQALAGNESKCRFVYALAPFHDKDGAQRPFRFDTEEHYQEDLKDLKAKYQQTIDAGVRQIALLADDSTDWGQRYGNDTTYLRILRDLTDWIHELQSMKADDGSALYPGLKDTILYCPALYSYTGAGESWYKQMPENIQIVMTGGRTFGIANHDFASRFKGNTDRAPFLWINWPCTDMARNYEFDWLTMGGHNTFLKSDVVAGDLDGLMLNPMQQSEPSKQAIFMAADYAWNLWTSPEEGDQAWMDSFSYIEGNSPVPSPASNALRDLSANMRLHRDGGIDGSIDDPDYDQGMQWWKNHESEYELAGVDVASTLAAIKPRLENGTATQEDLAQLRTIYGALGASAKRYRSGASDEKLFAQMEPFVGSWDDTAAAAVSYLNAIDLARGGDKAGASALLESADKAFESSQSGHKIDYLGVQKDARVGLVIVTPTLAKLKGFAKTTVMSGSGDGPVVSHEMLETASQQWYPHDGEPAVADGNPKTSCIYKSDSWMRPEMIDAAVIVTYPNPITATGAIFIQGAKDMDGGPISQGVIEYQDDQGTWHKINDVNGDLEQNFEFDQPVVAKAVRVVNKAAMNGYWRVQEIGLIAAPTTPGDPAALKDQIAKAEAISDAEKATWTDDARAALGKALEAARAAADGGTASQTELDSLQQAIVEASKGIQRYQGMTLDELNDALLPESDYTPSSYALYRAAFDDFAAALEDASNLPQAEGEALKAALDDAAERLAYDRTEQHLALLAWEDAIDHVDNNDRYTEDSHGAFMAAYSKLGDTLSSDPDGKISPATYRELRTELARSIEGLEAYVPEPSLVRIEGPGVSDGQLKLTVGDNVALIARVSPDGAKVNWSSSNAGIVSVDDDGTVTAVSEGVATVAAQIVDGDAKDVIRITVSKADAGEGSENEPEGQVPSNKPESARPQGGSNLPKTGDLLTIAPILGAIGTLAIASGATRRRRK